MDDLLLLGHVSLAIAERYGRVFVIAAEKKTFKPHTLVVDTRKVVAVFRQKFLSLEAMRELTA
jgi:hypothetical protein